MTEDQQLEYDKCAQDPIYFINKYTYFYKYSPLLADFKLYPFQEGIINSIEGSDRVLINNCRQMGVSTILMGYALWKLNFTYDYRILHLNISIIQGVQNLNKLKDSYDRLPEFLKIKSVEDNKKCLKLVNGSVIRVGSTVSSTCGVMSDLLLFDNAAFVSSRDGMYGAAIQTLRTGGKAIIASTLYKKGWFQELCKGAEEPDTFWHYIKLPYYLHPKRDRLWRWNREYELGHNASIVECDCTHYYDEGMSIKPLIED